MPYRPFAQLDVMWSLLRHGGSLRIGSLQKAAGLATDALCEACNTLQERQWITVVWRRFPRADLPERLRRVDRVTATRFGRSRVDRTRLRREPRRQNVDLSFR